MKRVLIACEYSGTVRDAFTARGWEAMSCGLLDSENLGTTTKETSLMFFTKGGIS